MVKTYQKLLLGEFLSHLVTSFIAVHNFFSIKLSYLHYTNKQRAYNIEIKNIKRNYYTCTEPYEPLQKS